MVVSCNRWLESYASLPKYSVTISPRQTVQWYPYTSLTSRSRSPTYFKGDDESKPAVDCGIQVPRQTARARPDHGVETGKKKTTVLRACVAPPLLSLTATRQNMKKRLKKDLKKKTEFFKKTQQTKKKIIPKNPQNLRLNIIVSTFSVHGLPSVLRTIFSPAWLDYRRRR